MGNNMLYLSQLAWGVRTNKANKHISRGKYKRKFLPLKQQDKSQENENVAPTDSASTLDGSHINLNQLASFISDVSSHSVMPNWYYLFDWRDIS